MTNMTRRELLKEATTVAKELLAAKECLAAFNELWEEAEADSDDDANNGRTVELLEGAVIELQNEINELYAIYETID